MSADVTRFPVRTDQRIKNRRGKLSTSCFVTERWVRFHGAPSEMQEGSVVWADIMTTRENGSDHKLCEFCFNITELEVVLQRLKETKK